MIACTVVLDRSCHRVQKLSLRQACTEVLFFSFPQDEENHEQTTDVRSQLRFFEQLERMEKQRKDEQEREILLKAAKVVNPTIHELWRSEVRAKFFYFLLVL